MARNLKVGERVTVKTPVEAYYSRYGTLPECWFTPGMVGYVAAVKVPVVFWRGKGYPRQFVAIEFNGTPYDTGSDETATSWRVGVYERDLVRVN